MGQLAAIKAFSHQHPLLFLPLAALLWLGLYLLILPGSELLVSWLPVPRQSQLGSALQFFLYDTPKVLLLLTGIVFVMGMINSWFTPERTRALLAGRGEGGANVLAALLGIVTPFCSCSAVPLFIGFVQAGVPLGVTFSFLISAPMVNEVALTLGVSPGIFTIGAGSRATDTSDDKSTISRAEAVTRYTQSFPGKHALLCILGETPIRLQTTTNPKMAGSTLFDLLPVFSLQRKQR